jgi:hypothetical protein
MRRYLGANMTEPTTRTISFSTPMIKANLTGTKSQTRRTLRDWESYAAWHCARRAIDHGYLKAALPGATPSTWVLQYGCGELVNFKWQPINCPYGAAGDFLIVKEAAWMWCERRPNGKTATGRDKWLYVPLDYAPIHYAADHPKKPAIDIVSPVTGNNWDWRLKIARFLPYAASRMKLKITNIRLERLLQVTDADCIAEGIQPNNEFPTLWNRGAITGDQNIATVTAFPKLAYQSIWEAINGEGSWDRNPWVWVIEYEIVEPVQI